MGDRKLFLVGLDLTIKGVMIEPQKYKKQKNYFNNLKYPKFHLLAPLLIFELRERFIYAPVLIEKYKKK